MPKSVAESIQFFKEDIDFRLPNGAPLRRWFAKVVQKEGSRIRGLNFILCSDAYLRQINNQYLSHDFFTDVVTFDNSDQGGSIEGDIFISVDRVRENAVELNVPFASELRRVMVHGLLHLLGYSDKSSAARKNMRSKEDEYLSLW